MRRVVNRNARFQRPGRAEANPIMLTKTCFALARQWRGFGV
jgi:hypothetical protein